MSKRLQYRMPLRTMIYLALLDGRLPIDKRRLLPAADVWPCLPPGLSEAATGEAAGQRGRGGERRIGEEDVRVKSSPLGVRALCGGSTFYGAARSAFALPWPEPLS
jgi:hypothetical protein